MSRHSPGFVLVGVLLAVGTMSLLVTRIGAAARTETRIAANLRGAAQAEAAADGAIAQTTLALLNGAWQPGGGPTSLRIGEALVRVRVTDQAGKLNPNDMTRPLVAPLQALLNDAAGVPPLQALALAQAIVDWRSSSPNAASGEPKRLQYQAAGLSYAPSDRPFEALDELQAVLGMTPDIYARIAPRLSLYAEPALPGNAASYPQANLVVEITATATAQAGARFTRSAIVRLLARPAKGQAPFQVLTWDSPGLPAEDAAGE